MDQRSIRTHKLIKTAFLELLKQKELTEITITELCQKSHIHRKTFYSHFKNTSEILEEIFSNLMNEISSLYQSILEGSINDFHVFFTKVNEFILKDLDFYRLLSKTTEYAKFMQKITQYYTDRILNSSEGSKINGVIDKYSLYFLISGVTSMYFYWIENAEKENIEAISSTCEKICNKALIIEKGSIWKKSKINL